MDKRALLLLGGTWHDFEGFHQAVTPLLQDCGYTTLPTYDMDAVHDIARMGIELIVQYTSFGVHERFPEAVPGMTLAQAQALSAWVARGGRLLGVHGATVIGPTLNPVQAALYGARFLEHPPQFTFTVYPLKREHPLLAGVEALAVHDEFYMQAYAADLNVHMVALDRGQAYPMVWTSEPGTGRIAYIAMGHSAAVWELAGYRRLLANAIAWLADEGKAQ